MGEISPRALLGIGDWGLGNGDWGVGFRVLGAGCLGVQAQGSGFGANPHLHMLLWRKVLKTKL